MTAPVSYISKPSPDFPHVEWIELYADKILHECLVVLRQPGGNLLFIKLAELDGIDKDRIVHFLRDRNVRAFSFAELLRSRTLPNGINALEYFHQMVQIITPNGQVMRPQQGQSGVAYTPGQTAA